MADAVQTQEAGGGEGSAAAAPEVKSVPAAEATPAPVTEVKSAPVPDAKPTEVAVQEETKPASPPEADKASAPHETKAALVSEEATPAPPLQTQDPQPLAVELQAITAQNEINKQQESVEAAAAAKTEAVSAVVPNGAPVRESPDGAPLERVAPEGTSAKPTTATDQNANNVEQKASTESNWQQRELELLKKIEDLEKVKNETSENELKLELKVRDEEIDLLKARVRNLETELQAALSKPGGKNHEMIENIKQQHEELLSKARGMIFDKTKMVKNQELQIEALNTQVQSLKDINQITKDLLEIRNSEIKAMEDRLQAMEARFKTEKERYGLVLQRAQCSSNINDDLKKEYETQLAIFKELRGKYEQRVQALVAENERLKASIPASPESSTSAQ